MYYVECHFIDGEIDQEPVISLSEANERAERIANTFRRAAARGDILDDEMPWIAVYDADGIETRH